MGPPTQNGFFAGPATHKQHIGALIRLDQHEKILVADATDKPIFHACSFPISILAFPGVADDLCLTVGELQRQRPAIASGRASQILETSLLVRYAVMDLQRLTKRLHVGQEGIRKSRLI
jgi:hypothetical protein